MAMHKHGIKYQKWLIELSYEEVNGHGSYVVLILPL